MKHKCIIGLYKPITMIPISESTAIGAFRLVSSILEGFSLPDSTSNVL